MGSGARDAHRLPRAGGLAAGPIDVAVGIIRIPTRDGFEMTRHPLSFMSLGDSGRIQFTGSTVTGPWQLLHRLLCVAEAKRMSGLGGVR